MLAKKQPPFARPHLLDREFHFQSGGTGHLIFGGAHLAYIFCCGRFFLWKVSQGQPLTLPNKLNAPVKRTAPQRAAPCLCRDLWSLARVWWRGSGWKEALPDLAPSLLPCGFDLKDGLTGGLKLKTRCPLGADPLLCLFVYVIG